MGPNSIDRQKAFQSSSIKLEFISLCTSLCTIQPSFHVHPGPVQLGMPFTYLLFFFFVLYLFSPASSSYNTIHQLAASFRTPLHLNITVTDVSFLPNEMHPSTGCLFPSYFSNFAVLILVAVSIITQLSHLSKIALMVAITGKLTIYGAMGLMSVLGWWGVGWNQEWACT